METGFAKWWLACLALLGLQLGLTSANSYAEAPSKEQLEKEQEKRRQKKVLDEEVEAQGIAPGGVRRFHQVLEDLLAEFSYDIKTGQLSGLKNLAIRKVEVNENLPRSYRSYLSMLVSERIRENADVKLLKCLPCDTKTSSLVEGKIIITSPSTNVASLRTAAQRAGIENFLDVILVYHTTHMVMAFQIFDAVSHQLVWARAYNSETIRSRFQELAIDYKQIAASRDSEEYEPEYRLMVGLGGGGIPNIGGTNYDSSTVSLLFRSTEKFDRRRSEVGMTLNLYMTISSLLSTYPIVSGTGNTETTTEVNAEDFNIPAEPEPFSSAIGLHGIYARNFVGPIEFYSDIRQGIFLGLGLLMASAYLAPSAKLGYDLFLGKRYSLGVSGMYIAPSSILIGEERIPTKGGFGIDINLAVNF